MLLLWDPRWEQRKEGEGETHTGAGERGAPVSPHAEKGTLERNKVIKGASKGSFKKKRGGETGVGEASPKEKDVGVARMKKNNNTEERKHPNPRLVRKKKGNRD